MDLSGASFSVDLPRDFGEGYDEKYLLVHIVEKNRWVVVSRRRRFHSGIYDEWRQGQLDSRTYNIHGGGILQLKGGKISTFGSSGGYGIVTQLNVVKMCLASMVEASNGAFLLGAIEADGYVRE